MGSVMAILGCQLDYIWNDLQSRNGGHICEVLLGLKWVNLLLIWTFDREKRHASLIWDLESGRLTFNLGHSAGNLFKDMEEGSLFFFACLFLPQ